MCVVIYNEIHKVAQKNLKWKFKKHVFVSFFFKIRILPWCSVLSLIDKNLLFSVDDTHPVKSHVGQYPGKKGEEISFKNSG